MTAPARDQLFEGKYFNTLFEISPVGMVAVDLEGMIIKINPAFCEFLGYSQSEILHNNFLNHIQIRDLNNEIGSILDLVNNKINSYQTEKRYIHSSGKTVYALQNTILIKDDNLDPVYFLIQIQDISKQKENEQILQKREETYRNLIEALPDSIAVLDYEWRYVMLNKAAVETMTKLPAETLIGVKFTDFQPGVENTSFFKVYEEVMQNRKSQTITDEYTFPDGRSGIYEVRVLPVPEGIMLIGLDLTERMENEKKILEIAEMEKLRAVFFSNLSHEFRTPISIILLSLKLIEKNLKGTGKTEKYLRILKQNSFRLVRLVNNLIDVTKIDSGLFPLNRVHCNISEMIENIVLSLREYMNTKEICLVLDKCEEKLVAHVDCDMMERVILNLLSNAYKFTEENGLISVKICKSQDCVRIDVVDTGIGIPQDKQSSIFERFRQVDRSTTRQAEGSGIGLSLVKSLIELHGGSIEVESTVGKGNRFTVVLPLSGRESDCEFQEQLEDPMARYIEKI
ncbi:MAG TPA: hypothetical protein DD727_04440, partial [Clostridiales bacterium]|nr:hypothetical protein [Clostridiales bacterium]